MALRPSAETRRPAGVARVAAPVLLLLAGAAGAMQALDESAMSGVHARDGLEIDISSTGTESLAQLNWITDAGASAFGTCTGGVADRHACTLLNNLTMAGDGMPLSINAELDVGSSSLVGGINRMMLDITWQPNLLVFGGWTLNTPTVDSSANSLGTFAVRSSGNLNISNVDGLFNGNAGNSAMLSYTSSGDVFFRQGGATAPELSLANFTFANRFTTGAAGGQATSTGVIAVDNQGLLVTAPYAQTSLLLDFNFKAAPANFDTTGRSSITLFGWNGGLVNPTFRVAPGGIGYGTYATTANTLSGISRNFYADAGGGGARSEGLNITSSWDFDTDFDWRIGQAGGNRTQLRFSNWRKMGTWAGSMLSMPVTLDVMQNNVGPAGLCFGGGFTGGAPLQADCTAEGGSWIAGGVPAGAAAFAAHIRDGYFRAYNQTVDVFEGSPVPSSVGSYRWSLLYTFGKLDADMYFYPQGRAAGLAVATTATGIRSDITLMTQSPGYWDQANGSAAQRAALYTTGAGTRWSTNTHFMLADTAVGGVATTQYGVGLVNADLLWKARNMYLRIIAGDSAYPNLPGGLWLQTDTGAQYRFRGLLGGGNLMALSPPSQIALMDVNLSTNRFIFVLAPGTPVGSDVPIAFAGLLDFDGTSYFRLAEPSQPASYFSLSNVSGRVGWANGKVNLVSGPNNPPTNLPKLVISNDLLFGSSATFGNATAPALANAQPLIGNVGFGAENFGRIVFPAGQWNSEIAIKIPGT
ncbi:MAG: hypothetical protein ACOY33_08020 [Pseudomonadota bacterium]